MTWLKIFCLMSLLARLYPSFMRQRALVYLAHNVISYSRERLLKGLPECDLRWLSLLNSRHLNFWQIKWRQVRARAGLSLFFWMINDFLTEIYFALVLKLDEERHRKREDFFFDTKLFPWLLFFSLSRCTCVPLYFPNQQMRYLSLSRSPWEM